MVGGSCGVRCQAFNKPLKTGGEPIPVHVVISLSSGTSPPRQGSQLCPKSCHFTSNTAKYPRNLEPYVRLGDEISPWHKCIISGYFTARTNLYVSPFPFADVEFKFRKGGASKQK